MFGEIFRREKVEMILTFS